jgi:hypothetical protein
MYQFYGHELNSLFALQVHLNHNPQRHGILEWRNTEVMEYRKNEWVEISVCRYPVFTGIPQFHYSTIPGGSI